MMNTQNPITSSYHSKIDLLKTRFLLQDIVKTTFRMKNLTQRWTQSGLFFQGHFFQFFKKNRGGIICFSLSLAILCLRKRCCCSAFLLIHLRFLVQQLLSHLARIWSRQYLFISSGISVLLLKLSTTCLQEKSSHKKDHAYLTDQEYFTLLQVNSLILKRYLSQYHQVLPRL